MKLFLYTGAMLFATMALPLSSGLDQILAPEAKVERVLTGYKFTEGPAWTHKGTLIFSDINGNQLLEMKGDKATVYREPSGNANGNTIGPDGFLYTAGHGARVVTKTDANGHIHVVADLFEGKKFNSPNDLAFRKNGDLYFTDPAYGLGGGKAELAFKGVFRLAKDGKLSCLGKDFQTPNGIVFSPDEKLCYVADTERHHVRVFDVAPDGGFANGRVFAKDIEGYPDGMRVDVEGNLYVAAGGGIHVFTPKGEALGVIPVPETPTNCAWGEDDARTLYVTAQSSVYKVRCRIKGVRF